MSDNSTHKVCSKCGESKSISAFHKQTLKDKDGNRYIQNTCSACKSSAYRARHPDKATKYTKAWAKKYPERAKRYQHQSTLKRAQAKSRKKEALLEHMGQRTCCRCGFSDIRALCFHHRDPDEKSFTIATGMTLNYSLERLKEEVIKCDVLCQNCHTIEHTIL